MENPGFFDPCFLGTGGRRKSCAKRKSSIRHRHPNLDIFIEKLFRGETTPEPFKSLLPKIEADKKKSIGRLRPWGWWVEVTRGCNLRCGFCATRLFPRGEYRYMSMDTWKQTIGIVKEVSPYCRVEIGNAGEPTLNPGLLDFLAVAREQCPTLQLMLYTNGTTLIDGRMTYRSLFEAGLNMVFVDMYAPLSTHVELVKESGYDWYEQARKPKNAVNIFEYQDDPDFHLVMLCKNPGDWPRRKVSRGAFSTFFNNLDWPAAERFGLHPVTNPPARRCDLPAKFPNVYWDGAYSFCCFDFMREVAGTLGNVNSGVEGFFQYWLGEYMQNCRRLLYEKRRALHPMCSRCAFTSIRCDIGWWPAELLNHYWTGEAWVELPEGVRV